MIPYKIKRIITIFLLILILIFLAPAIFYTIDLKAWTFFKERIPILSFSCEINLKTKIFFSMVVLVTIFVLSYREIYIEHYNNKKFFTLLICFFFSMIFLSSSNRIINLMMGWEYLGLTSLCLIIFYPNKIGKFNSIMTIIFNRMGDVILIFLLGVMISKFNIRIVIEDLDKNILILFLCCALTKRAQFPTSAWLPAAIAAPTPISAIVHSSTLVTAGLLLILVLHEWLIVLEIIEILLFLSCIRFFLGGFIRTIEKDYKKIVAFSTMSQIRMIILFSTIRVIDFSFTHIFYHAIFKTLLFCSAGAMFIIHWRNQFKNKNSLKSNINYIGVMIIISVFRIRGLIFSSSFFTKDLFLELEINFSQKFVFIFVIISSMVLTIIYSVKILNPFKKIESRSNFSMKNYFCLSLIILIFISLLTDSIFKFKIFRETFPLLKIEESLLIFVVLILIPSLVSTKILVFKDLYKFFTMEVAHIKFIMHSIIRKIINSRILKIGVSDLLFSKKVFLISYLYKDLDFQKLYPIALLICILMAILNYSNSLGNMALKMPRNKNISL